MPLDRKRAWLVGAAMAIALLILLFPPWRAQAIRTTTRYAAAPGVEPATVVDTVVWSLSFAPVWAPPRVSLTGDRMRDLANRALAGDAKAATELRESADQFEGRFHVPAVLRINGALWRDSVLARAGIPSVSGYDLTFAIDERSIAARLIVLALLGLLLDNRLRYARPRLSHRR